MSYEKFKTGLSFREVRAMLKAEAERKREQGEYMFITRHTVLGRWKEIKERMYFNEVEIYQQMELENAH